MKALADWQERLGERWVGAVLTSAATGQGLDELRAAIVRAVPPADEGVGESATGEAVAETSELPAEHRVYRPGATDAFRVERIGTGEYRVVGERVERLLARHDLDNEDALRYIEDRLRRMGVIKALLDAGFEAGDDVEIAGTVFELDPGEAPR